MFLQLTQANCDEFVELFARHLSDAGLFDIATQHAAQVIGWQNLKMWNICAEHSKVVNPQFIINCPVSYIVANQLHFSQSLQSPL